MGGRTIALAAEGAQAPPPLSRAQGPAGAAGAPLPAAAPSDAALVRRCLADERDAFGELVARHEGAVHRVAWRVLRSADDAEDAAQEAFVRAWRALPQVRPGTRVPPVDAANRGEHGADDPRETADLRAAGRGVRERRAGGAAGIRTRGATPRETAQARELLGMVREAVDAMPAQAAALFQLRYGEELSVEDIAQALDMKPGAVAVALHRLRGRIRRIFFGEGKGDNE